MGADDLGEEGFRAGVAVEHAVFAAFFIVEDELQGDPGPVRPLRVRRRAAVAGHVARIIGVGIDSHCLAWSIDLVFWIMWAAAMINICRIVY